MNDTQILRDRIAGIKGRLSALRLAQATFQKAQGISEQIEKTRKDVEALETQATEKRRLIMDLQAKKNGLIVGALGKIVDEMNTALPSSLRAMVSMSADGKSLSIGRSTEDGKGGLIHYCGLSGGERACFDTAIAKALQANLLLVEAAEMDDEALSCVLERLCDSDLQIIVSTCHMPSRIPQGWEVVEV